MFGWCVSHPHVAQDDTAFQLTKDMLVLENKERLSAAVIKEYELANGDTDATSEVVERLQRRVVSAFLPRGRRGGYFHTIEQGILFLRGHVGNFPHRHEELKECANYVRYTAEMKAGDLRAGDILTANTLQAIPLVRVPAVGSDHQTPLTDNTVSLYDVLCTAPHPTTLLVASSYS
jgi:hypothetical protein